MEVAATDSNPITLECDITIDDVFAWNYYYAQNNAQWKKTWKLIRFVRMPIMVLCFLVGVMLLISSIDNGFGAILISMIPCIFGASGFVYLLFGPKILKRNVWKNVRKVYSKGKHNALGLHKYTFSIEGISGVSELGESFLKWQAIERIILDVRHLFIVVSPNQAFIIPKRSFPDEAAFGSFALNVGRFFLKVQKAT